MRFRSLRLMYIINLYEFGTEAEMKIYGGVFCGMKQDAAVSYANFKLRRSQDKFRILLDFSSVQLYF